jgi:hypothetical protein
MDVLHIHVEENGTDVAGPTLAYQEFDLTGHHFR